MKGLPTILSTITALTFSSLGFAQDMSGWSDKTICRLIKQHSDNSAYLAEAESRKLACASQESVQATIDSTQKLKALKVPEIWTPIRNRDVFEQEREIIAHELGYKLNFVGHQEFIQECVDYYLDFKNLFRHETLGSLANKELPSGFKKMSQHCGGALAHHHTNLGFNPKTYDDILLSFAANDALVLPVSKNHPEYPNAGYQLIDTWSSWSSYYALYANEFEYTPEERKLVENYLRKKGMEIVFDSFVERGHKKCNPYSISATITGLLKGKMGSNNCGSLVMRANIGLISLGLRLSDQKLFNKGIDNLVYTLKFFTKDGVYVGWAAGKGASALSYQENVTTVLSVVTELLATIDYDFLEHQLDNGIKVKDIFAGQLAIIDNPMLLWKYVKHTPIYGSNKLFSKNNFKKWFKDGPTAEGYFHSATNKREFIRESARYIDTYRPDLQHLRLDNYQELSDSALRGDLPLSLVHSGQFIEGYKLYEANTKTELDPYPKGWKFRYKTKEINASKDLDKQAIVTKPKQQALKTVPFHVRSRLEDFSEKVTGSRDYLQVVRGERLTDMDYQNKAFALEWYFINAGPSGGDPEYLVSDTLVFDDAAPEYNATEPSRMPNLELRQLLRASEIDGLLTLEGNLDLGNAAMAFFTVIKINVHSGFGYGVWEQGDVYAIRLSIIE